MSEHYFKLEVELTMFLAGSPLLSQKGYGKGGGGIRKSAKEERMGSHKRKTNGRARTPLESCQKSSVEVNFSFLPFAAEPVCINFHAVGDYKCSAVQALPKTTKSTLVPIFQSLSLFWLYSNTFCSSAIYGLCLARRSESGRVAVSRQ